MKSDAQRSLDTHEAVFRSVLLTGSVAIVTGAAQGMGRATAEMLAANGARVCVADLDKDKVEAMTASLPSATAFIADLESPGAPDRLVAHTIEAFGQIDILVNNAGYHWGDLVRNMSDEQFMAMVRIHMLVPFQICRAAAPYMCDREPGTRNRKVVMVSSMAWTHGAIGGANYAAAKTGLVGLTRSLAREWGPFGVNVNAVAPGVINTRLYQPAGAGNSITVGGRTLPLGNPHYVEPATRTPSGAAPLPDSALGRVGRPQEVADVIFWLCSPLSDYVTGQVIPVTGGMWGGLS